MRGSRLLAVAVIIFASGLVAALVAVDRFSVAYGWVAHTSDVRLVIGRAVGDAGGQPSCPGLRADVDDFARLTVDNSVQQARVPALRDQVASVCAGEPAGPLIDELGDLDATERDLLLERRGRLSDMRTWTISALGLSVIAAIGALVIAGIAQRRALRALAGSEERFRLMATTSRDVIRIHDADGRPTYCSPSVELVLGYTPAELLALPALSLGHPDDLDKMRATLTAVQADGAPGSTLVYRLRAKDGAYRWFETHTNPVRDHDGKLLRFHTAARDVTDRVELEQKLEAQAVTDELTGLSNRRGFMMIAGQEHHLAVRQGHGLAVIFADLDGLKTINDRLGHDHGDRAIRALAELLRESCRESDVIARLGGDEFAVLAYGVDDATVEALLERIRAALAAAPPIGGYPLAASLGVALLAPGTTTSLDELIVQADQRMYEQKRARKG